jgi:hypothetical protein
MARVAASEEDERTARLRTDVLFDFHVVNDTVESAMASIRRILGNYRQFEGRVPGLTQEWRPRRSHRDTSAVSLVPPVSGDDHGATSQGLSGGSLEGLTISEITRDPAKVSFHSQAASGFTTRLQMWRRQTSLAQLVYSVTLVHFFSTPFHQGRDARGLPRQAVNTKP